RTPKISWEIIFSMRLKYRVVDKNGKITQGTIEAKSKEEAATFLRGREFMPIEITPEREMEFLRYLPTNNFTASDLVFFTRQLSSMIASGLTLVQALRILREQIRKPAVLTIVDGVIAEVEEGKPLSGALAKYPNVFSPIYISLIKAAETSGLLDKILVRLADNLEKEQKLKSTIKSALMYPVIIVVAIIIVATLM